MAVHAAPFCLKDKQAAQLRRGERRFAHRVADLDGKRGKRRQPEKQCQFAAGVIDIANVNTHAHYASIAIVECVCHVLVAEVRQWIKCDHRH
jgi:hypothetical protein